MGIKGTVRRSTDGDFIHANVDIDLIITEEPDYGSLEKPSEIFNIIEHFCLGRRRSLNVLTSFTTVFSKQNVFFFHGIDFICSVGIVPSGPAG